MMTNEAGPTHPMENESATGASGTGSSEVSEAESSDSQSSDSTAEDSPGGSSMTLAFAVGVIDDFADPAGVFDDARRWSSFVGVISDKMAYQVVNYLRDQGIYNEDFFSRADKARGLRHVKRSTDTDRHVFVGDSETDAALADDHGWEYLPLDEAAAAAEWDLVSGRGGQ